MSDESIPHEVVANTVKEKHESHKHVHHEEPFNLMVFIKDSVSILIGIAFATVW